MSGVSRLARGGASVALGLALVTPLALPRVGLSEGEVAGHSMEPTYHVGDYVFTRQATPVVGDVVRVRADDEIFVHRIVTDDGRGHFTTKGDGNRTADGQTVTAAQIDGVVVGHLGGWQAETWRWLTV